MTTIDIQRKTLNQQQTELRKLMGETDQHDTAIKLFLRVHASYHTASISNEDVWSYQDALLDDVDDVVFRRIPQNEEHSIAWTFWHITRIEDTAMNVLVAGSEQVLYRDNWLPKLGTGIHHSGNAMTPEDVTALSATIDFPALRGYRAAVGRRTREIALSLQPGDLSKPVDPVRLEQVMAQKALLEAAMGVKDYWGKRTIAGLLLMPASRHILVHLNEALKLKKKRR
jgi:hypothetical protein